MARFGVSWADQLLLVFGEYCVGEKEGRSMNRTIVVVGMLMFKIKELVKVSHKSEIWSEDIGNLRETLDKERKVRERKKGVMNRTQN